MGQEVPNLALPMLFRVMTVEHDIVELKAQMSLTVATKENDIEIVDMRGIIQRMEIEVEEVKKQLEDVVTKQIELGSDAQKNIAALQIRVLWGAVSLVVGLLMSVLVGYITHLFR
ncbi:MAG: hypothetical protein PVS3B1_16130 [Ktedonobacteraceae bacterium]